MNPTKSIYAKLVPNQRRELIRTAAGLVQSRAVRVERRPIHRLIACAAMSTGVSAAAMAEAGDVPDEDLVRAEAVRIGASRRWVGDPLPGRRLNQLAQHGLEPTTHQRGVVLENEYRPTRATSGGSTQTQRTGVQGAHQ